MAATLLACPTGARAVSAAASITVTPTAVSFTSTTETQQYLAGTPALAITGTLITKFGTGSIAMLSPGDISGSNGGVISISFFSMTCGGAAQTGQTFVATKTPLVASSSVTCANYANGYNSSTFGGLNFTLNLFLDERTMSADTYPSTNFTIVATAT